MMRLLLLLLLTRALGLTQQRPTLVVGCAGGVAETVACGLLERGVGVALVLDRRPLSPVLRQLVAAGRVQAYVGALDKELESAAAGGSKRLEDLLPGRLLVAVGDEGDDALRQTDKRRQRGPGVLSQLAGRDVVSSSLGVVCVAGAATDGRAGLGALLGGKASDALREACGKSGLPFSLLRFGQLTGGVPGARPLPFVGLPALEPELHPSYLLRAVVLTDVSSKYSETDPCTRDALAEAAVRLCVSGEALEGQLISIAGTPPSEQQWGQLFSRLRAADNVELMRIEFAEVVKPAALTAWLVDSWFPQALIDADAATILSGARPVRATKTGERSMRIVWEDMGADLSVRTVGGVDVRVDLEPAALVAVRASGGALPGEMALMDRLVEGVNKNVYKKSLATPRK